MIWWKFMIAIFIGFIFGYILAYIVIYINTIGTIIRDISDPENPRFRLEFNEDPDECLKGSMVRFKIVDGHLPSVSQD